jgi:hypothetical protein
MLNLFKPAAELERSDQENRRTGTGKRSGTIILGTMLITFAVCIHEARAVELITNGVSKPVEEASLVGPLSTRSEVFQVEIIGSSNPVRYHPRAAPPFWPRQVPPTPPWLIRAALALISYSRTSGSR